MNNAQMPPLDIPIIAWFSYLNDCQVKISVCLKEKNNAFFLKNPVKPPNEWKLDLIIRSITFPDKHPIKFMRTPFNELDYWESSIIKKVGHSEFAEVYEVSKPQYFALASARKSQRIFCLLPVKCQIDSDNKLKQAICVDIADDGNGLGLRFDVPANLQIGSLCKITMDSPLNDLPEIVAKVARQSISALDRSVTVGLIVLPEYIQASKLCVKGIAEFLLEQSSKESNNNFQSNLEYPPYKGLVNDVLDSFKGF